MAGLLSISEPNAGSPTDMNNQNDTNNDFLASLVNDATQAPKDVTEQYTREDIEQLFDLPLMDLLLRAQTIHRENFNPNEVQISTLLSIKTGNCPEDCGYCSQSGHHRDTTKLQAEKRLEIDKVIAAAKRAKATGSSRFCMGAAWKHPSAKDMPYVVELVKEVKALGLETCMTLGMLDTDQATLNWLTQDWIITITISIRHDVIMSKWSVRAVMMSA